MAQYRFEFQHISRGEGRSIVAKAAYNARDKIRDERTGELYNFTPAAADILFSGIFVDPKRNAPERVNDRARLWNAAAAAEKRKDAREGKKF